VIFLIAAHRDHIGWYYAANVLLMRSWEKGAAEIFKTADFILRLRPSASHLMKAKGNSSYI